MINRLIFISTLILATSLSVNWVLNESESSQDEKSNNHPDIYMRNAQIAEYNEAGELRHTLFAAKFTHFPLTDLTTLRMPQIEFTRKGHWEISADEGRLLPSSKYREEIIELWDSVLANQSSADGTFTQIQTKSLTVYPERGYLETDKKVYIDNEVGRTTATGMKAFLDSGHFQFFSKENEPVTTIFLPN